MTEPDLLAQFWFSCAIGTVAQNGTDVFLISCLGKFYHLMLGKWFLNICLIIEPNRPKTMRSLDLPSLISY